MAEQLIGHWWTPSAPEEKLFGTLTLSKSDGPSLELVTAVCKQSAGLVPALLDTCVRSEESLIIHGQAHCGRLFTLYDGFINSRKLGMGSVSTATLYFNHGFEGACIDDPMTLSVQSIYMRYPGMDAWLGARPFTVRHEQEIKRVSISHTIAKRELFHIDDQRKLILSWSRTGPKESIVQTRIGIEALPWLGIEYVAPVPQNKASEDSMVLAELLSVLLGEPTDARQITVRSPQYIFEVEDKSYLSELKALGGYFKLPQSFRKWMPFDALLPFSAVRSDFESLLQKWFKLRHDCWGAIVPYLAAQRIPSPVANRRFFDLAAVAESLHTHLRPDEENFSNEEARAICGSLRASIPKSRRRYFYSALRRVNELTYKERLERLLQRFPSIVKDVVGDANEQATFCRLVKDLRNLEAHRLRHTDETRVGGLKLVRIAAKLKVIIDAWILAEIGIPESAIEQAMRRNRKYWFYASAASWPWNIAAE